MLALIRDGFIYGSIWDTTLVLMTVAIFFLFLVSLCFAGYTLFLRLINTLYVKRREKLESRWEQLSLDVLAEEYDNEHLYRQVRKKDELYFVDFLQRFARIMRGEELEKIKSLAHPYLDRIHKRLSAPDAERRARAIKTLSIFGLTDYVADIVRALDDPSPLVAMVAARSLIDQKHPEFIQPVLDRLHRFENWSPEYMTSMLVQVGAQIIPNLQHALTNPFTPTPVKTILCRALTDLNDFPSADIANNILQSTTDHELTAACLRLLARMGRPEHLSVIRTFVDSPHDTVRIQAMNALGQLGEEADRNTLAQAVWDESPWVALQAARGLRDSGDIRTLKEIAQSAHERAVLAQQVLIEETS